MENIKIIAKTDGQEIRGTILSQDDQETIIQTKVGKLIINTEDIASVVDVLDSDAIPVGKYVKTESGIYLKIDKQSFRLVRGTATALVDLGQVLEGTIMDHSEVFNEPQQF